MLKRAAVVFGMVALIVGILGFVPGVTNRHMLLGLFHVNAVHNAVHILSGVLAIAAGLSSVSLVRTYFRVFGGIYVLVAALGFLVGDGMIAGVLANNVADTWLHVAIAAVALYLGFVVKDTVPVTT